MRSVVQSASVCAALLSVTLGVAPGVAAQGAQPSVQLAPSHALRELDSLIAKRPSDATVLARIAEVGPAALRHTYRQVPMSAADVRRRVVVDSVLANLVAGAPDSARWAQLYADWLFESDARLLTRSVKVLEHIADREPAPGDSGIIARASDRLGLLWWRRYEIVARRMMVPDGAASSPIEMLKFPQRAKEFADRAQPMRPPMGETDLTLAVRRFERAFALDPTDSMAFRHLAMARVEQEDWYGLEAFARGARAMAPNDPWRALAHGLALHRLEQNEEAARAFDQGFAQLPASDATHLQLITRVMKPADTIAFHAASPTDRSRIERTFWEVANPSVFSGGNVMRSEFRARIVHAQLRWSNEETGKEGVDTDRGVVFIRWGPPTKIVGIRGPSEFWWYDEYWMHFLFNGQPTYGTSFMDQMYRSYMLEEMAPFSPAVWRNLPEVRSSVGPLDVPVVRFRASDGATRVLLMPTLPVGRLGSAGTADATQLRVRVAAIDSMWQTLRVDSLAITQPAPKDSATALSIARQFLVPRAAESVRLDVIDDVTQRTAHASAAVKPLFASGFEVSDLAVARTVDAAAVARVTGTGNADAFTPLPSGQLPRGDPLSLYFEVYEPTTVDGTQLFRVEIDVARVDAKGLVPTVARMLGNIRGRVSRTNRDGVLMTYDVERPSATVHHEALRLSLGDAPAGRYRLRVSITDLRNPTAQQTIERTSAEFTLVGKK